MSEHSEEGEEKVPGLRGTEVDSNPSIDPKVDPDLPRHSDKQGSNLTPIAGLSETELTSDVGMLPGEPRWPTPESAIPRHDTVDSGVDLTLTHDLDIKNELAPGGMQEEPFITLYVDRAVSPNSDAVDTRDWIRAHDLGVDSESPPLNVRAQAITTLYVDRAVSPKSDAVDARDWNRAHDRDVNSESPPRNIQVQATTIPYGDRALSADSQPADTRTRKRPREKLAETFHLLSQKRTSVLALRYEVQEARSSLRHEREDLNTRDAQIIQKLRAAVTNRYLTEQDRLLGLLEDLQTSRDSLLPKEDDYERLEDRLNREEWELKEMERTLLGRSVSAQISLLDDDDVIWFEDNLEQGKSSASVHSGLMDDSPPMKRYLSRKGDVEILKEQLTEMQIEHGQLVEDEEIRARIGLNLDADSRAILAGFDKRRDALLREISSVEEDVSRLQDALFNKDDVFFSINRFHGYGPELSDQLVTEPRLPDHFYQLDIEGVMTDAESLSRDPLLLSGEESRGHEFVDTSDDDTNDGINTPRYVNQWLLHILRRSIPEVQRFKSTDELREVKLRHSQEQIRDMALEWWFKDQSVRDFERSREVAALTFDHSVETDPGQFRTPEGQNELDILTLVEPVLQIQDGTPAEAYTSTFTPPTQALTALSLAETP